ncbi:hypothetical protein ABIE67_000699 [Streptomyces sp. V4I8]
MKRRIVTALVVAATGLMLCAVPAAARAGHGSVGSDDWNIFITNIDLQ